MLINFVKMNLCKFDDGAPMDGGSSAPDMVADASTQTDGNTAETGAESAEVDRNALYEKFKKDYKDLYDADVKRNIDKRFKKDAQIREKAKRADSLQELVEALADKYGKDANDTDGLTKAYLDDNAHYEDEAMEKGLTVEQLKEFKRMERENAKFRAEEAERQQNERIAQIQNQWLEQSDKCKEYYPDFDFSAEFSSEEVQAGEEYTNGERFSRLLQANVDVKTAYEIIHKDQIITSGMAKAAQAAQEKTVASIKARGMRPQENGGNGAAATGIQDVDPSKLDKKGREEFAKRIMKMGKIQI